MRSTKIKKCVINFVTYSKWYPVGQRRLKKSFLNNGYKGDFLFFKGTKRLREIGCPSHEKIPYAFKAYVFKKAQEKGYNVILWADASICLQQDASKVFNIIEEKGYWLMLNGWTSGEWCADTALAPLGITREESFNYPHIMASVMGLDLRHPECVKFLEEYYEKANDGISFVGAWRNRNKEVSKDPRVLGHRHDQTAASIIAWRLGMRDWLTGVLCYDKRGVNTSSKFIFELRRHG